MQRPLIFFITGTLLLFLGWSYSVADGLHHPHPQKDLGQVPLVGTTTPVRIPILVYHSVRADFAGETLSQKEFTVSPEMLEKELQYLKDNHYTVVSLDALPKLVETGTTTQKMVILTFDDGWENQYIDAFPLLKKYGFTATFFVFTNPISKDERFVTWPQVLEMDKAGMTIGDHTTTHPYLTKLPKDKEQDEILVAKKVLEEKLGKPVRNFASPFGQSNDQLVALVKDDGFATARTLTWGASHSYDDLLHLPAYLVGRDFDHFVWVVSRAK